MSEQKRYSEITPEVPKARQGAEIHLQKDWSWVEASVWTNRMLAALENGVKGGKWFSLMDKVWRPSTLDQAWKRVKRNRGAAGVDRISTKRFERQAERYLQELSEELRTGRYKPQGVRRVYIPKSDGKCRPLGIPTVKDRIVQMALKLVLEPIYEHEFMDHSYGFRPHRGCKDALREVDTCLKEGYVWAVDADLKSYFDTIPHERLMSRIKEQVADRKVQSLLESFLTQQIMEGMKQWTPEKGSPQGAVVSPLLSNVYLHGLDVLLGTGGYRSVRYADDFVVLCKTEQQAQQALADIKNWVEENELELHPDKTHVGDSREPGEGFEFLGYRFEGGRRWVRKKSLKALKEKIKAKTGRSRGDSMESIIEDLNPMLRGWFGYFKHADRWTFQAVDGFVRRRLRAIRRKQTKRPGFGKNRNDHRQWPNAYFAKLGLFTMKEAWVAASQSR